MKNTTTTQTSNDNKLNHNNKNTTYKTHIKMQKKQLFGVRIWRTGWRKCNVNVTRVSTTTCRT